MRKKEVKAILFDLDGVLVDSYDAWFCVMNDVLHHYNLSILNEGQFAKRFGFPIERDIEELFFGKKEKEIINAYIRCYQKHTDLVKLYPHSIKVLENIRKKGLKIALVSNSARKIVHSVLKKYKLKKYFDSIITMDDVKNRKPHPESVLKACKSLNVKPNHAIFVGDTKNDMLAGKRAGCITIGYKIKGDHKIARLQNLEKFI